MSGVRSDYSIGSSASSVVYEREGAGCGLLGHAELDQLHDVRGVEEVQREELRRPSELGREVVQRKRGRIGGQHGARGHPGFEVAEEPDFGLHVLERGLDHEIAVRHAGEVGGDLDARQDLIVRRLVDPALLELSADRLVELRLDLRQISAGGFDRFHLKTSRSARLHDASAHLATTHDTHGFDAHLILQGEVATNRPVAVTTRSVRPKGRRAFTISHDLRNASWNSQNNAMRQDRNPTLIPI